MSDSTLDTTEMSFIEHLEELRWHIIRAGIVFLFVTFLVFLFKDFFFSTLILGLTKPDFLTYQAFCKISNAIGMGDMMCLTPALDAKNLQFINVTGPFLAHLKISLILGIIISFPYLVWETWRFIKPGLHDSEQNHTRGFVFVSSLLFFIGTAFGYLVLSPFSINFFATYTISPEVSNQFTFTSYISIISTLVMASGIMFELPLVIYFLSLMGLVTPELMREYRKHAFVVILLVAAVITPADIWTMALVSVPVYVLYELSIGISGRVARRLAEKETAIVPITK